MNKVIRCNGNQKIYLIIHYYNEEEFANGGGEINIIDVFYDEDKAKDYVEKREERGMSKYKKGWEEFFIQAIYPKDFGIFK